MRFDGFAGNSEVKCLLSSYVDNEKFPHALLIEGAPGTGRHTLARLLARAAVCEGHEKPCGVCAACAKAAAGIHPDIKEYAGDGSARSFHIDAVRDLREQAYVLPNEAARQVMILTDADTMTPQAQNALLKILEEPPERLLFILTCQNRTQLLPTVRSRTVTVTLHGAGEEEALPLLQSQLPQVPEQQLREALVLYDGAIGRVISAVSGDGLHRIRQFAEAVAAAVTADTEWELTAALAPLDQKDKTLTDDLLEALILIFRDALAIKQGSAQKMPSSVAVQLSQRATAAQLASLVDVTRDLQRMRRRNANQTLLLTVISARLRTAAGRE